MIATNTLSNILYNRKLEASRAPMASVLDHAILTISKNSNYKLRASIFMPTRRDRNKLTIRYCSTNMSDALDRELVLEKWQGSTGKAWGYESPIIGDLTLPEAKGGSVWGLTDSQKELTKNLATILSYPIRHPRSPNEVIGILSIDSPKPIAKHLSSASVQDSVAVISAEIASILLALKII
jgi:hypothetical protein